MNEQWEQPDREAVIRDNPLLEYCQREAGNSSATGPPTVTSACVRFQPRKDPELHDLRGPGPLPLFWLRHEWQRHRPARGAQGRVRHGGVMRSSRDRISWSKESWLGETDGGKEQHCSVPIWQRGVIRPVQGPGKGPEASKAGRPSRRPQARRSRQSPRFEDCRPRASLSPLSEVCSFAPTTAEGRAWIITDCRRMNAQARRLDGEGWEHRWRSQKAWTLPGSIGALPIGLYEALDFPNIALVEGGPDLLAAFHLAWCATSTPETLALGKGIDVVGKLGVVAMLGRHPHPGGRIAPLQGQACPHLRGCR